MAVRNDPAPKKISRSKQDSLMLRTKSLRVGIQIRRSRRQLHRLHPGISYHLQKLSGEQRITIVNLVSLSRQDSLLRIREIARDLAHPQSIRATRDPRNLDLQCGLESTVFPPISYS